MQHRRNCYTFLVHDYTNQSSNRFIFSIHQYSKNDSLCTIHFYHCKDFYNRVNVMLNCINFLVYCLYSLVLFAFCVVCMELKKKLKIKQSSNTLNIKN